MTCDECGKVLRAKRRRRLRPLTVAVLSFAISVPVLYLGFTKNDAILILIGLYLFIPGELLSIYLMINRAAKASPELNVGYGVAPTGKELVGLLGLMTLIGNIFLE